MNICQSNYRYRVGALIWFRTLQTEMSSLNEESDMKKARVELISLNTVDEKETSSYIFVLTDEVTDEDLLELISILENKTEQVCHDWAWCIPPSQSRELINNKLITLEQL
jgi:hypothetical protein